MIAIITFKEGRYKGRRLEVQAGLGGTCYADNSSTWCCLLKDRGCMKATHHLCKQNIIFKDAHDPE